MIVLINKDYYKIYEQFGNPKDRMIDALIALRDGKLMMPDRNDLYSMPQTNVKRVELDCDELRDNFPGRMIRNILHWFIDNECYIELGWKPTNNTNYTLLINNLNKVRKIVLKLPYSDKVISELNELENLYRSKIGES